MSTDVAFVLGTRPEIIKLAPVIRECERNGVRFVVVHTGQHYSENLNAVFFEQLSLPRPDYELDVGSKSHGRQTGEMIGGIESALMEVEPETVLVQGDTNTVLAGAIAADKLDTDLGHVEAGLRSFDRDMPEESNRRVADHLSDYLFAPTEASRTLLRDEGIDDGRITVTGNTVVDALYQNVELASEKSTAMESLDLAPGEFALVTAHRAENVDRPSRLAGIVDGVDRVGRELDLDVVYPIHPRARERLDESDVAVPDAVELVEPLDYLDFLALERDAALVLTDSGGVQEEACVLGVPCVTMRDSTERPETIEAGANRLAGTDPRRILDAARDMISVTDWSNPFGDGDAAKRILNTIRAAKSRHAGYP